MLDILFLSAGLSLGQAGLGAPGSPPPPPALAPASGLRFPAAPTLLAPPIPEPRDARPSAVLPTAEASEPRPILPVKLALQEPGVEPTPPVEAGDEPAVLPEEQAREAPESQAAADRWWLMRSLQGTWLGALLDDNRLAMYGWTEASFTASTAKANNQPYVWNDRANEFLLQQHWVRFERTLVSTGTTEPTFGFRSDWLFGSDYRFSLPRGIWNSQLINSTGAQNLYGVDPIAFYGEMFIPTLGQGTDIKVGRWYTPFGSESLEAVSTPLLSRSYAFNWCPPFTHTGILATTTLSPVWTMTHGLANGNDVFIDPSQEMRYIGALKWTQPGGGRNTVTFGTSLGRGKMNAGDAFFPATAALSWEPAGRNNINVFDMVYTHIINSVSSYALEVIYGYQTGVPANVPGGIINDSGISGNAHWGSICEYLNYTFSGRTTGILRWEFFDDFEGQRTGFEGLYTSVTAGIQFKPMKGLWFRPELRYDYNGQSTPFEGKHYLFTASSDVVVRW